MNVLIYGDIQTAVNIIDIIIDMKMILKLQKCTFMNTASDKLKIRSCIQIQTVCGTVYNKCQSIESMILGLYNLFIEFMLSL